MKTFKTHKHFRSKTALNYSSLVAAVHFACIYFTSLDIQRSLHGLSALLIGPSSPLPSLLRRKQYYCWIHFPLHPVIDVPTRRRGRLQTLVAMAE
jgi:hypothetical protein